MGRKQPKFPKTRLIHRSSRLLENPCFVGIPRRLLSILSVPTLDEISRGDTLYPPARGYYQVPGDRRLCSACLKPLDDVGRDHFLSGPRLEVELRGATLLVVVALLLMGGFRRNRGDARRLKPEAVS